jgi:hypothetical protein
MLHGFQSHNFMLLSDCTIGRLVEQDKLDEHLNFLVGANGSRVIWQSVLPPRLTQFLAHGHQYQEWP